MRANKIGNVDTLRGQTSVGGYFSPIWNSGNESRKD